MPSSKCILTINTTLLASKIIRVHFAQREREREDSELVGIQPGDEGAVSRPLSCDFSSEVKFQSFLLIGKCLGMFNEWLMKLLCQFK